MGSVATKIPEDGFSLELREAQAKYLRRQVGEGCKRQSVLQLLSKECSLELAALGQTSLPYVLDSTMPGPSQPALLCLAKYAANPFH